MFSRPHHLRVARVLGALDAALFANHRCYFGGGTAIALRFGEFRESVDVDFLVSDVVGFRALRERATAAGGVQNLARAGHTLVQAREVRADQYGLRTLLDEGGVLLKLEIVLEARVALDTPEADDVVAGVTTLSLRDLATSKLLANADRFADDSVFSRDVIDLAMMNPARKLFASAVEKAERPYGEAVRRDLVKAIDALQARPGRLEQCMTAMQMELAPGVVWARLKRLRRLTSP